MHPSRLAVAALILAATGVVQAQSPYRTSVIETGLENPRGIALAANGDLYFTEVPTPGMNGMAGGRNRVNVRSGGSIQVIETGMPEPLHIAMSGSRVFWTCRTAGVIFERGVGPIQTMLDRPTGLAADDNGTLWFTELPTPGMPGSMGGRNTVNRLDASGISMLSGAEPQPNDIVVAPSGDLYWTCTTAGVIVRQSASGQRSVVARGLDYPMGLAVDAQGVLYFTEVPTPGVNGPNGGSNEVWRFDPRADTYTLVSRGEPEPYDIAVNDAGTVLYWTCSSAGVIVRADLVQDAPDISSPSVVAPGATVRFFLDAPNSAGQGYVLGNSLGLGSIDTGSGRIGLADDDLLATSIIFANTPGFVNYRGLLDLNGMGTAQLVVPNDPSLSGLRFFTAFITLDGTSQGGVGEISRTLALVVN